MIRQSKQLIETFDRKFTRKYSWRYHILNIDNHYLDQYLFFLQFHKHGTKLHYSYDLLEMPRKKALYGQVLKDLKIHTHHLVHHGTEITFDQSVGTRSRQIINLKLSVKTNPPV